MANMYLDLEAIQDSSGTYNLEDMYSLIKTRNKNSKPLVSCTRKWRRGIKKCNKKEAGSKNTSVASANVEGVTNAKILSLNSNKRKNAKIVTERKKYNLRHRSSAKKSSVLPTSKIESSNENESIKTYPDLLEHAIHRSLLEERISLASSPNEVHTLREYYKSVEAIHDNERLVYCSRLRQNEEVKKQLPELMFPCFVYLYLHLKSLKVL